MSRASVRQIGMQVVPQNLFELWAVFTRPVDQNGLGFSPEQTDRILGRVEASVVRLPESDQIYNEWRRLVAPTVYRARRSMMPGFWPQLRCTTSLTF